MASNATHSTSKILLGNVVFIQRVRIMMKAGFMAGTCSQLSLSIIKDGVLESDETFQLSAADLSSHAMPSSTNGATALITITDDDSACESLW